MDVIRSMNLGEKVSLLGRILFYVPPVLTRELIKTVITTIQRGLPLKEFMVATVVRTLMTCFTNRQLLYFQKPTGQIYQTWIEKEAKTRNLSPVEDTVVLADGTTRLHWIRKTEDKRSSKVVLLFHGGGYHMPSMPEHLSAYSSIINASGSTTKTMAAALLEYDLTTEQKYPRQLQQANMALEHILQLGYQPGDIFIGGDSAGGHLSVSLLSHLMHKHPSVPSSSISGPLAGAFLISPWVTGGSSSVSFRENAWIDMLPHQTISPNADFFVPSHIRQAETENKQGWAMALAADVSWWSTLSEVVSNVYITAGEQELFRDHIIMFADMIRRTAPKCRITFELGVGEAHVHMLIWEILHAPENPALKRFHEWFVTVLQEG